MLYYGTLVAVDICLFDGDKSSQRSQSATSIKVAVSCRGRYNDPDLAVSGYVVPRLELAGVSNSITRTMSVRAEPRLQFSRSDDGCIS